MSASQTKYYSALVLVALTIACRSSGGFNPNPPFLSGRDISPDGVWERLVSETFVFDGSVVKVTPRSYAAFRLKATALDDMLSRAPLEFTSNDQYPVVLTLPQPNGSFGRFQIEESPIMEPELAKRFPMIKTYRGKGLDDRTATARFERSRRGLHAMVLSASGAFLVDAIGRSDANLYVSYFKSSLPPDPDEIACRFSRKIPAPVRGKQPRPPSSAPTPSPAPTPGPASSPGVLRTYRLAVAASHLYVEAIHNLSDPNEPSISPLEEAVTAITRTIDRVNIIFERDVGIHLTLVNNEDRIIHTDASTDPYHDFADDEALLRLNQSQLDDIIHPENYDVGHLFLVSRGGVAAEPCACSPFYKGEGLSGSPHPTGGAFDVQYVSHEIGHQFGASHSFNGTTKGCKYRNSETAYEPGSGSTIMGYSSATKICEQETIQSTADPYFHAISLQEIRRFVTRSGSDGGDSCAQKSQIGNRFAPQVNGGPNFTIPGRTPFALTAASSS